MNLMPLGRALRMWLKTHNTLVRVPTTDPEVQALVREFWQHSQGKDVGGLGQYEKRYQAADIMQWTGDPWSKCVNCGLPFLGSTETICSAECHVEYTTYLWAQ